jgi:hypothetical protein
MKKFSIILTLSLLALLAISTTILSLLLIWGGIDIELAYKIKDMMWLAAIIAMVSFVINIILEE